MYGPSLSGQPECSYAAQVRALTLRPHPGLGQTPAPEVATDDPTRNAAALIRSRGREFRNLGEKLRALMHRAAVLAGERRDAGDFEGERQAKEAITALGRLNVQYGTARDKLEALIPRIPALLGVVPVVPLIYAGAVVAAAVAIAAVFRKASAQERMLDLIAAGKLTATEAERLNIEASRGGIMDQLTGVASLGRTAGLLAAIGAGIWAANQAGVFKPRRRR